MSGGYFNGFVDHDKRHAVAKCRWCGEPFARYFAQWACVTPECQERCAAHAVLKPTPEDGTSPFLYLPLPLQVEVEEHPARRLLVEGPAGWGKSYGARWRLYKRARKYRGYRGLLLRCTYDELDKNHLQFIDDEIAHFEGAKFKRGTQEAKHVVFADMQSRIYFGYCQHKSDILQYRGPEYDDIEIEEASEFIEDALTFIPTRDRGSATAREAMLADGREHGQTRLRTNPGGRSALLLRDFYIDRKPDPDKYPQYDPADYGCVSGRIEDNPYLSANHKSSGLGGLDAATYAQQADGRWDVFPGQFFPDWRETIHVRALPADDDPVLAVLIYGFHAHGVLFTARLRDSGHLHVESEWKFRHMTIAAVAKEVAQRTPDVKRIVCPHDMVDDSETDAIKAESPIAKFARHGVQLVPVDADTFGWDHVHDYLRPSPTGAPWLTVSPECPHLARTLPTLVADENHPEELAKGQADRAALALRTLLATRPLPSAKAVHKPPPPEYSLAWWKARDETDRAGLLSLSR